MEVTRDDFAHIAELMDLVDLAAAVEGVEKVELSVTIDGQRFDIGYGERGVAAITYVRSG